MEEHILWNIYRACIPSTLDIQSDLTIKTIEWEPKTGWPVLTEAERPWHGWAGGEALCSAWFLSLFYGLHSYFSITITWLFSLASSHFPLIILHPIPLLREQVWEKAYLLSWCWNEASKYFPSASPHWAVLKYRMASISPSTWSVFFLFLYPGLSLSWSPAKGFSFVAFDDIWPLRHA